ncbi:hypothetical protein PR003_g30520 [Phytophthora rubi]|uniref:Uncharacterized protein n=1 Tax=Phytophthora rubi TaxID=129364 RepID=A0A6A3H2T2_9STRA|nr:hypothetical protein PR001_g29391 [Phytophthora rubi]KAE9271397.1 hypothetical protein PR003_g30520 [Phytophthora rubi]
MLSSIVDSLAAVVVVACIAEQTTPCTAPMNSTNAYGVLNA